MPKKNVSTEKKISKLICPVCRGEMAENYKPFCSKRCADVDLNRWLDGGYRIPTDERPVGSVDDDEIV
ncbi:DNA gyrase inhibitor YacG [Kiloniella majae]|uniref:DNA gyrase inhibitor YacG n=1 Tax=Kiloniella majae TaxID=1938558 RepID=UPI000A2771AC|nr:DNA gyrase inhibitor YacG [Kiloniella majae]